MVSNSLSPNWRSVFLIEEHKNSRIYELDALRAFGFLFVVAQHVFGGFAHRPEIDTGQALILSLIYVIAKPAVPIFMVLLGLNLFLYSKYKKPDFKEFYKKKIKNYLYRILFGL
ncbi:MAG TPA: hypothetical protein DD730_04130 [Desulfosporosinus sp.]|nr:hypothetical protein [Desulfosporosinus sp.]